MDVEPAAEDLLGASCERLPKRAADGDLQRPWAGFEVLRPTPWWQMMVCSCWVSISLAAPNTLSNPSMVLMKPAADELLLELVERSLSVELHASRSPPAPPTWPSQPN